MEEDEQLLKTQKCSRQRSKAFSPNRHQQSTPNFVAHVPNRAIGFLIRLARIDMFFFFSRKDPFEIEAGENDVQVCPEVETFIIVFWKACMGVPHAFFQGLKGNFCCKKKMEDMSNLDVSSKLDIVDEIIARARCLGKCSSRLLSFCLMCSPMSLATTGLVCNVSLLSARPTFLNLNLNLNSLTRLQQSASAKCNFEPQLCTFSFRRRFLFRSLFLRWISKI